MDIELPVFVSKNIKNLRLLAGISQAELAELCGLKVRYVQRIENDSMNLTLKTLAAISRALKVKPEDLLVVSSDPSPPTPEPTALTPEDALDFASRVLQSYKSSLMRKRGTSSGE